MSTATRGLSPALLSSLLPSFLPSYSSSPPLFLDDDDDQLLPIRFSPTANLRNCALQRTTTTHLRAPPPPPSETGLLTDDWWLTLALYSLSHAQVSRWLDPAHVIIRRLYAGMPDQSVCPSAYSKDFSPPEHLVPSPPLSLSSLAVSPSLVYALARSLAWEGGRTE